MKIRHKNIPAVYLVLRREDEVLLAKRQNTGYEDGNYSLVAGHLEPDESFRQCIVREAMEEIGIVLSLDDLEFVHLMHRKVADSDLERVDVFFAVQKWEGEVSNKEPNKCDHLKWFRVSDLPKNTIPYIKKALAEISKNKIYSEFGWGSE